MGIDVITNLINDDLRGFHDLVIIDIRHDAEFFLLGSRIEFVVVPSPPHPPVEPLLGLRTPAECVHPPPILSISVAVVSVVVVVVVPLPPLPPPNALPSSSSSSMAGMAVLTDRFCVQ